MAYTTDTDFRDAAPEHPAKKAMISRKKASIDDYLFAYSVITIWSFCLRDALTAAVRYYLDMVGLGILWFVPDILAFGSVAAFGLVICMRDRNMLAILFFTSFLFAIFMSVIFFSGHPVAIFSGIKMFIPIFVGLCFRGRNFFEVRYHRQVFAVLFLVSAIGVAINPYIQYPWLGFQTTNAFGVTRAAQRLWWTGGVVRYGGLAGDSTMAAFMILFSYIMLSPYMGVFRNMLCWPLVGWSLHVTTSKTALGLFGLFVMLYLFLLVLKKPLRLPALAKITAWSFLAVLLPPLLILVLNGVDLTQFSRSLGSFSDRINNTWGGPFPIVGEIFPVGLFLGCGLGCYAYPMTYVPWLTEIYLPLDNFYLTTFLDMGYPFAIFVICLVMRTSSMRDPVKLFVLFAWNIWTITVQGYGPSFATLIFGYAVSEIFAKRTQRPQPATIRQPDREDPGAVTNAIATR